MGSLSEKEIRAYQLKDKTFVCPVCATDEEKEPESANLVKEDAIHDNDPQFCVRCRKKI
jgi:hypothetical protein